MKSILINNREEFDKWHGIYVDGATITKIEGNAVPQTYPCLVVFHSEEEYVAPMDDGYSQEWMDRLVNEEGYDYEDISFLAYKIVTPEQIVPQERKTFVVKSTWMCNGDSDANQIEGIYDSKRKAQKCLCELLYNAMQNYENAEILTEDGEDWQGDNLQDLANMFEGDKRFSFEVGSARVWNGEDDMCCEEYINYDIDEYRLS